MSLVGALPLNQGFNVYARLGYNHLKADNGIDQANDSGVLYGVGVGYSFNPKVSGRIEVQKPSSDSTNVGASVVYQF